MGIICVNDGMRIHVCIVNHQFDAVNACLHSPFTIGKDGCRQHQTTEHKRVRSLAYQLGSDEQTMSYL